MKRLPLLLVVLLSLAVAFSAESAARPTGKLKVSTPGVVLELKMGAKPAPLPNGREVPLPVGSYQPAKITCYAPQAGGKKPEMWSIECKGPFGELKEISVTEGEVADVQAGAPFQLKPVISSMTTKAGVRSIPIGFTITGKAGEAYSASTIMKNKIRVPAPQVKILDEKGTVLAQGTFEYG
ncbi:MAG: hypothetical protein IMZ55_02005 [Acidobacteria bacterium]|nr:hypothetical protein [Acidobacteriota bacterium]